MLERMLATLLKGKNYEGTSETIPPSPISSNIAGKPSIPQTKDLVEISTEQQLSIKHIELPTFTGGDWWGLAQINISPLTEHHLT